MSTLAPKCGSITQLGRGVLAVHYSGKDTSKGARGSLALKAAGDVEILVEGIQGQRTATVTTSKYGEAGYVLSFELERVVVQGRTNLRVCEGSTPPWEESGSPGRSWDFNRRVFVLGFSLHEKPAELNYCSIHTSTANRSTPSSSIPTL
jgi:hypothetical protein